ncbi:LOW QUALITY PROTEIN: electrogenic sodium bicarbonate cotransporter 1-like [Haliotis rubra]|uniref:LOW QUALITY PROTEIN: electrogenic sodium bicarbonate cotransporter 1-like n=1 Tax=Haliotis rubra TaxID=36100 RepID=UPI001EE5E158|nr:LOW QUALITY PROTEIN: electrogenic sodium bicarbonate cotransporter 1-like [Haliotis rubra]
MDPVENGEAVRDMGANRQITDPDFDTTVADHRHQYIGLRLPHKPKRPGRGHSHRRTKGEYKVNDAVSPNEDVYIPPQASLTPSEQIHHLLDEVTDDAHQTHDVFCQMDNLYTLAGESEWREMARWVKYEEDVEEGGERWSKPHVASLSLHSLFELRSSLMSGCVTLEMDAYHITQVADLLLDNLIASKLLEEGLRDDIRNAMLSPHVFQHTKRRRASQADIDNAPFLRRLSMRRSMSDKSRNMSIKGKDSMTNVRNMSMKRNPNSNPNFENTNGDLTESASSGKLNQQFMRKIPEGAEAANIMVGEIEGLKYQVVALVRLIEGRSIGDLTEVPIPTRFLFFFFGPPGSQAKNIEIGRAISTIMVDQVFREVAYKARSRQDILAGVDEFLDQVTALPPGEWDPKIRIEPPQSVPSQEPRKAPKPVEPEEPEEEESHCDPTLQRSGRLFGGMIADIKRKLPWYGSDFKDCLHIQCVASVIFLYLATLTPNVTFGGLLGQATDQYMGTMECILTAAITGVLFALFAGQPLNILGSTGPMLVLEMILYHFCHDNELDFLPLRCWIGLWTAFILLLIVAFDLSALVRYITRFTEESFACLIAVIFIAEAFKKLVGILDKSPVNTNPDMELIYDCECFPPNSTNSTLWNTTFGGMTSTTAVPVVAYTIDDGMDVLNSSLNGTMDMVINWTTVTKKECIEYGGELIGEGCNTPHYVSDVFFLSVLLFLGTFTVASALTGFKNSSFFPTFVRQSCADFAVLIAILLMVGLDAAIGIHTPKLEVPEKFKPTRDDRGWFVNPWSDKNPWWMIIAAIVPALLATILVFMDQQITAVIVNRKENKLKKGSGYHLDMFVVAICIALCSLLGLPWYVAATVSALAHVMSLKKESECTAPGEKPTFLGCREQRVTALMVGLLSGLSVLFTTVLKFIPMPVLYGVFLYMGVAALKGMQFIDRLLLLFMPKKYQPDFTYLRHVPTKRVHLFTFIQAICLAVLWVIKTIKSVSIIFPIMVLGTCFVRKGMDYIFTQHELKWLDDIMPEANKKAKDDAKKKALEEAEDLLQNDYDDKMMEVKYHQTHLGDKFSPKTRRVSTDTDRVNISEEMAKTAIWLKMKQDSDDQGRSKRKKSDKNGRNGHSGASKANFYMGDEEEAKERESKI